MTALRGVTLVVGFHISFASGLKELGMGRGAGLGGRNTKTSPQTAEIPKEVVFSGYLSWPPCQILMAGICLFTFLCF